MAKAKENFWSERMVFGVLIIGGYLLVVGTVSFWPLPPRAENLVGQALGALGSALGVIVAAIWKTDKSDREQTQALTALAAQGTGTGGTIQVVTPPAGDPPAAAILSAAPAEEPPK